MAHLLCVIVCFVDAIVFAVVLGCVGAQPFRLAPYLRLVLVMLTPVAAQAVASTISLMKAFVPVVVLFVLGVTLGAALTVVPAA